MGQVPSGPARVKSGRRRSFRSPLPRKSKSNLSHTFSITPIQENVDLININYASEEQLMTLPGISRQVAQAIVEHRQAIGRFKKVDDLALVSGMGAEKLNLIRNEVCIGRKLNTSPGSRTQSLDSVRSSDSGRVIVDLNTVNVFQLQCVPGLNQELAANIIDYRKKKGYFKCLDDLIKVKGIDAVRLSSVKSHLTLSHPEHPESPLMNGFRPMQNGMHTPMILHVSKSALLNGSAGQPRTPGHRKSLSVPIKCVTNLSNGFSLAPVNDIFDLLSAYSRRPIIEEEFTYQRDGKHAFRLATWNLHQLNSDKANNPGFREVVCRTILENKFSIIGIQDVLEEDALKCLCDELNLPSLRRICEWKENSKKWKYFLSLGKNGQHFGMLYDEFSINIHVEAMSYHDDKQSESSDDKSVKSEEVKSDDKSLSQLDTNLNYCLIECKINKLHLIVINVHLTGDNTDHHMELLCDMIDRFIKDNKKPILIGDFHSLKSMEVLTSSYKSVIDPACSTHVETSGGGPNCNGRAGIFVPEDTLKLYTERSGLVRSGLCHLAIPKGWTWGGPASPHCPVWAEFFTYSF